MSRRYTSDHKLLVLRLLNAFNDDVTFTSRFTRIPERTLRDWRRDALSAGGLPRSAVKFQLTPKRRL
jgi:hypothetical protein